MKKLSLFLLVFLCGCTGSHTLFHKGTSSYTIVIDADAPASGMPPPNCSTGCAR